MHVSVKNLVSALALAAGLSLSAAAKADTITWTQWTSATAGTATPGSASGTIVGLGGGITVTYSGQLNSISSTSNPNWLPASTYSGGMVGNAPDVSNGENGIDLNGGQAYTETITFSQAINNPVFAFWSLGQLGSPASFNFASAVTCDGGGAGAEYGGTPIACSLNSVSGQEGNGVAHLSGNYTSISFTTPQNEGYYAFTVGAPSLATASATPEPSSLALLGTGLAGLGGLVKRRFKRS